MANEFAKPYLAVDQIPSANATDKDKVLTIDEDGTPKWKEAQGGGTTVIANPTLAGTEAALNGLQVGDTKYSVGGSPSVIHAAIVSGEGDQYALSIEETASDILAMELPILLMIDGEYINMEGIFIPCGLRSTVDGTTEIDFLLGTGGARIEISNGEIQSATFYLRG